MANFIFRLLDWFKAYRIDVIKAKAEASNKPYEAMTALAQSQGEFLRNWLDSFKMTEIPAPSVVRDQDEWAMEQERERHTGGLDPNVHKSIKNAISAGAFPELKDILS